MNILSYLERLDKESIKYHIKYLRKMASSFKKLGDEVNTPKKKITCRDVYIECEEIAELLEKLLEKL